MLKGGFEKAHKFRFRQRPAVAKVQRIKLIPVPNHRGPPSHDCFQNRTQCRQLVIAKQMKMEQHQAVIRQV